MLPYVPLESKAPLVGNFWGKCCLEHRLTKGSNLSDMSLSKTPEDMSGGGEGQGREQSGQTGGYLQSQLPLLLG